MSKESETHSVCNKHNTGGKSVCCECGGKTDCGDMNTNEKKIPSLNDHFGVKYEAEMQEDFAKFTLEQDLQEKELWKDKIKSEWAEYDNGVFRSLHSTIDFIQSLLDAQRGEIKSPHLHQ